MAKQHRRKSAGKLGKAGAGRKAGMPPGSLVHIGQVKTEKPVIDVVEFDSGNIIEKFDIGVKEASKYLNTPQTTWIKVTGLHNTKMIGDLGEAFGIHPLMLEDILNTAQRPKAELGDNDLFISLKALNKAGLEDEINADQLSFVLRKNLLISFHESDLPLFESLKRRLENPEGRLRKKGPDYLLYALVDIVVDHYFMVIENTGELIDLIEDELFENKGDVVLQKIQSIKRDLLFLKKHIFPLREAVGTLIKTESAVIAEDNQKYYRDVYDHLIQMYETIESYRDLNTGLKDIYLSMLSNRMNQVMKTLTIIATIFIPLTFIVGVYGMNFENMPELGWRFGYWAVWAVMVLISGFMLIQFRRRKWL